VGLAQYTSKMYTGIAAMLIESAAPFSILGIGLVVTAAQKGPLVFAFGYVWTTFCSFAPQMIILRVAMGHGLVKKTVNEFNTALVFAEQTTMHAQGHGVCLALHNTVGVITGHETSATRSEASIGKHLNVADVISC